jgi:hypothetical protein
MERERKKKVSCGNGGREGEREKRIGRSGHGAAKHILTSQNKSYLLYVFVLCFLSSYYTYR